ncbi:MAG TPA: galactokinase family protein, partial [Thermomicrobiales bacterium]|nr:galactokinase family protein [Thermomicrobiales bacterium]
GGHLDYNGGPVLAAAIDKTIVIRAAGSANLTTKVIFADFDPDQVHEIIAPSCVDWRISTGATSPSDFVRGVIAALFARGLGVRTGQSLIITGNLPYGVGISSSAALCVALAEILLVDPVLPEELVLIAQEAENRTGSPCGRMDQSASVFGEIIQFDGATFACESLKADLGEYEFVVANSGVVRSLATSVYPERVRESRVALELLRSKGWSDLAALAALPFAELAKAEQSLTEHPVLQHRLRHVVTETARVQAAKRAALGGDWVRFGQIMTEGGRSSSDDYGIGHPEVDALTSAALADPSVLGARIMGGGEGGAALLLVSSAGYASLQDHLAATYYLPRGFVQVDHLLIRCHIAPGASHRNLGPS